MICNPYQISLRRPNQEEGDWWSMWHVWRGEDVNTWGNLRERDSLEN
jgi:hypothetical protein